MCNKDVKRKDENYNIDKVRRIIKFWDVRM